MPMEFDVDTSDRVDAEHRGSGWRRMNVGFKDTELELMCEKMMIGAYALRDRPNWGTLSQLLEDVSSIAVFLKEQDRSFAWADKEMMR